MAMAVVLNPKGFVEKAMANGARYIKVLLFNALSIGKPALCGIVKAAHEKGLKVAVHATELATVRQAVDAGADILLHVLMKEAFPENLAKEIVKKGIVVAPTLVMMETFANSGRNGYQPTDYQNAESAVKLLHDCGVQILAATDANDGSFAPAVAYGRSMHREMELLTRAGMTTAEVLASATSKVAEVFGMNELGAITEGKRAVLLLIEGRPDKNITDTVKIKQIYMDGEPMLWGFSAAMRCAATTRSGHMVHDSVTSIFISTVFVIAAICCLVSSLMACPGPAALYRPSTKEVNS